MSVISSRARQLLTDISLAICSLRLTLSLHWLVLTIRFEELPHPISRSLFSLLCRRFISIRRNMPLLTAKGETRDVIIIADDFQGLLRESKGLWTFFQTYHF